MEYIFIINDGREELPYQFCILPIPSEEQEYLNNTNPFNDIDSSGRDKGFDFEFWFDPNSENFTAEDLSNGYKLRRIVAPYAGKIEMIHNATDYYCPGYGAMIAIRHIKDWITSIALETNCNDTNVQDTQDANILIMEGEYVER